MSYLPVKRLIDMVASMIMLLLLLPLLVTVALIITLESEGSAFFTQERIGLDGRPFNILKFRSMVSNASEIGSWQTQDNDPRITKFGRFIRKASIDELPQLINVLAGEMSLIGPRPNAPQQESQYEPIQWHARHQVRPGITGLAQVNGRSNLTVEEQIGYDVAYAQRPTFALDMRIALATVGMVLSRRGTN